MVKNQELSNYRRLTKANQTGGTWQDRNCRWTRQPKGKNKYFALVLIGNNDTDSDKSEENRVTNRTELDTFSQTENEEKTLKTVKLQEQRNQVIIRKWLWNHQSGNQYNNLYVQ